MTARCLPALLAAWILGSPAMAAVSFDAFVLRTGFEDSVCPDGAADDAETCDDGGVADGDGCSAGCRIEFGHYCDGAPSVCVTLCGDGAPAGAEGCDDAGTADGDGCSAECTVEAGFRCMGVPSVCMSECGDGLISVMEVCDDGDVFDGDGCSAVCTVEPGYECVGLPSVCSTICGDGVIAGSETCDDGDSFDGNGCSSECEVEPGFQCSGVPSVCSGICGDGSVGVGETCDDRNTNACGTCSADCQSVQSGTAIGHIVATAANELADGEGFTIHDGFQSATFEFDFDFTVQPGSAAIPVADSDAAGTVGTAIGTAIDGSPLLVQANSTGSALVTLAHARATSLGNQPIQSTVSAPAFEVAGLAGGAGGDCPIGVGCVEGDDCASGVCSLGLCGQP